MGIMIRCIDCDIEIEKTKHNKKRCSLCVRKAKIACTKAHHAANKEHRRIVDKNYRKNNRAKIKAYEATYYADPIKKAKLLARVHAYGRTLRCRHAGFLKTLRKEGVPSSDPLWNINFYTQLILDNRCHYCEGPLNSTGHGFDRVDNCLGHVCYNVVPCCRVCNRIKMHDILYEEMMLLISGLREIQLRRKLKKGL